MARFKKYKAVHPDGWSVWVYPIHGHGDRNYKLACCDCSLVHDVQFRTIKEKSGRFSVTFRVRRNARSTSAMRRKK